MDMDKRKLHPVDAWFENPKFGLFIHFGLYAIEGWHEQDQMRRRIPRAEYEKLITRFNPTDWNPDAILDLAESVGMEYVCLTTKHHDGFCLWDTEQTDYNVMNSPYGKDLVGELAEACHKRNFPMGLYYSVADWHHPNYPNEGRHHELPPQPGDNPNWNAYMDYLKAQAKELCTDYGEVRHWFWDINVPEHQDPSINQMLRALQPNIVINNRGFDDGDFGTPEREYGHDLDGLRPTEACNSVGTQSWGYRKDEDYYSTSFLIQSMDAAMTKGWHYLLNVGPDAEGRVPEESAAILKEIGYWYSNVRESFADVQPAPELIRRKHVLLTRRDNTLYVHVKKPVTSDALLLPPLDTLPAQATLLNNGSKLACSTDILPVHWQKKSCVLRIKGLPRNLLESHETLVIKLEFDQELRSPEESVTEFEG